LKELARSYLTISKDLTRVMNRVKALYRSWGIACEGRQVYAPRHRAQWLKRIGEALQEPQLQGYSEDSATDQVSRLLTNVKVY
jgi:hypothetical protein